MPIFASPLKDDGYDIADFRAIHPTLGTVEDFEALTKAAHAARHSHHRRPGAQSHLRSASLVPGSAPRSRLRRAAITTSGATPTERYRDARIIFKDTEHSNWSWDVVAHQYYWHRFYSHQPDLNYDNPAVRREILDVMAFWLDRGIDGFRVDAVPYLFEREGTNCENLPETHEFCREMRRFVDERYPGTLLLAEANQWPRRSRALLRRGRRVPHGLQLSR